MTTHAQTAPAASAAVTLVPLAPFEVRDRLRAVHRSLSYAAMALDAPPVCSMRETITMLGDLIRMIEE